jgi:hypothetical protein
MKRIFMKKGAAKKIDAKKRSAKRKNVGAIPISNLTTLTQFEAIARFGHLIDASTSGFLIQVDREDLVPKELRQNLSLQSIEGQPIALTIEPMELEINGHIARTRYIGKGVFEIAVDFSQDAPEYWRECLFDLLPTSSQVFTEEEE